MSEIDIVPFPPASIRTSLSLAEWETCLDTWLELVDVLLHLSPATFQKSLTNNASITKFVVTAYQEYAQSSSQDATLGATKALQLKKLCFRLVARASNGIEHWPLSLCTIGFLSSFFQAHVRSKHTETFSRSLWQRHSSSLIPALQSHKTIIVKELDSKNSSNSLHRLTALAPIFHASEDIASFFTTGADFVDALINAYGNAARTEDRKVIVTIVYLGLLSLVKVEQPNVSLLSDHLYVLKEAADKSNISSSLLADLVTNTSFLSKLKTMLSSKTPERVFKLLDQLQTYHTPSLEHKKKHTQSRRIKTTSHKPSKSSDMHVHKLSLVTQIQDLFPDLGVGFVLKLLDHFNDNTEAVTAALLDDSLPTFLQSLDRSESAPIFSTTSQSSIDALAPHPTPPLQPTTLPIRHNIFDSDPTPLTNANLGTSTLYIGKRDRTLPDPSDDSTAHPNKAAILSALATFDSDDDERDDTYDVDDVGGTIDHTSPDGEPPSTSTNSQPRISDLDLVLFKAWTSSPALFNRDQLTRRSQPRQQLLRETEMTNEALEGWAMMLMRDPARRRKLEMKVMDERVGGVGGTQAVLARTAWRAQNEESDGEVGTSGGEGGSGVERGGIGGRGRGRGGFRGRGRGRGGIGGVGGGDDGRVRRSNEANKGSRANHNRRDARARKVARGGYAG